VNEGSIPSTSTKKRPDGVIGNTSFLHDENAKYNPGSSPGRGTIKVLNCIRGFLNVQYGVYNIVKGITMIVIYFPRHCKVSGMISEGSEYKAHIRTF
jgi:hypothetical protein